MEHGFSTKRRWYFIVSLLEIIQFEDVCNTSGQFIDMHENPKKKIFLTFCYEKINFSDEELQNLPIWIESVLLWPSLILNC